MQGANIAEVTGTLKIPLEAKDGSAITKVTGKGMTTDGSTAFVFKSSRLPNHKKLKAAVAFVPRLSPFDIENERSSTNEFRVDPRSHVPSRTLRADLRAIRKQGFFTLFWISLFIWTVRTYVRSIEKHGVALNLQFATMFSKDARMLALSDAVLVLSTGICVPFAKAISKGWVRYYWTGVVLQHTLQTFILFAAIKWTFNRCALIYLITGLSD